MLEWGRERCVCGSVRIALRHVPNRHARARREHPRLLVISYSDPNSADPNSAKMVIRTLTPNPGLVVVGWTLWKLRLTDFPCSNRHGNGLFNVVSESFELCHSTVTSSIV